MDSFALGHVADNQRTDGCIGQFALHWLYDAFDDVDGINDFSAMDVHVLNYRLSCYGRIANRSFQPIVDLSLPHHCNKGKQEGDDGALVHVHLVFKAFSISSLIVSTPGKPISV